MRKLNLIVVFNNDLSKGLFCIRAKEPYKGKYNFVGGKVEENETNDEAAYRELFEETGISQTDIELDHFMDLNYFKYENNLQVYYGILKHDVNLVEEKNKLEEQKSYGQEIVNLYKYGQVLIDNELYLLDKFYIAYKVTDNGYEFHLKCAGANYSDILNKELGEYDYDGIIKFKNSSAFINLIEHQDIVIDYANNIIVVTDNKILTNIIDNWDGMLHDRVSDTDAISDKNILKRRTGK